MLVGPAIRSLDPNILHFYERDAVGFHVIDHPGADTARGDYPDAIPGVVRPLMEWCTQYRTTPSGEPAEVSALRDHGPIAT